MSSLAPETDLPVLEALAEEPSLSQRELARRAGLSLSKAHFVLRRLVEKGLVKVQNAAQSEHKLGYLYLLTPRGLEAKAKLTYAFLQRAATQYQDMTERLDRALAPVTTGREHDEPALKVAIVGGGPLADVVRSQVLLRGDTAIEADPAQADVAVLVDPAAAGSVPPGARLVRLA